MDLCDLQESVLFLLFFMNVFLKKRVEGKFIDRQYLLTKLRPTFLRSDDLIEISKETTFTVK